MLDAREAAVFRFHQHKIWGPIIRGLTTDLMAWYALEENFNEDLFAFNSVPPNANPLGQSTASPSAFDVFRAEGKVGNGADIQGYTFVNSSRLSGEDAAIFRFGTKDRTIALWFNLKSFLSANFNRLLFKGTDYNVFINSNRQLVTDIFVTSTTHSTVLQTGVWNLLIITHDVITNELEIWLNGIVVTNTAVPFAGGTELDLGNNIDAYLDEFAIWDRVLTADEKFILYNDGMGLTYSDLDVLTCRSLTCCETD